MAFLFGQVEERNGHLLRARAAYVKSVATCAANLRWKVWLGGARTELCHSQFAVSQVCGLVVEPPCSAFVGLGFDETGLFR